MEEQRITNELTGGMKGSKDSQLSCAPPDAMLELGKVYGFGAQKYDRHNFRKGYNWSLSYDALLRHVMASLGGEDRDPESGLLHMAHAMWHCATLIQFYFDKMEGRQPVELDDRYLVIGPTMEDILVAAEQAEIRHLKEEKAFLEADRRD